MLAGKKILNLLTKAGKRKLKISREPQEIEGGLGSVKKRIKTKGPDRSVHRPHFPRAFWEFSMTEERESRIRNRGGRMIP